MESRKGRRMVTRQVDYAIRMLIFMALNKDKKYTTDEVAEIIDIPRSFLPRIIASLSAKKIIFTYRGKNGGIKLAKDPSEISLMDVIEAIDGHVVVSPCLVDVDMCNFVDVCKLRRFWENLQNTVMNVLNNTKISDLIVNYEEAKRKRSKRKAQGTDN